jgi:carbon storage regulator
MLVLSRRKNERIVIDDHIIVTVVKVCGDRVRLGVEAPREVPVHRSEIYDAILKQSAAKAEPNAVRAHGHRAACC